MKVFCFLCEQFVTSGDCAHTLKEKTDVGVFRAAVRELRNTTPAKPGERVHTVGAVAVATPKYCQECKITLALETVKRYLVAALSTDPVPQALCDCCQSMTESLNQESVKAWFREAHLKWDIENSRRVGLIRGRI